MTSSETQNFRLSPSDAQLISKLMGDKNSTTTVPTLTENAGGTLIIKKFLSTVKEHAKELGVSLIMRNIIDAIRRNDAGDLTEYMKPLANELAKSRDAVSNADILKFLDAWLGINTSDPMWEDFQRQLWNDRPE